MWARSYIWFLPLLLLTSTASLAVPIVEDFEAASFVNHADLGDVTVIGNYRYSVDSAASLKSVVSAAALFPGYDPLRPTTTFTIAHIAGSEFYFTGFVATDQFEMTPASVVVRGYRNGVQVTSNETVTIPWPSANIDFSAKPGFTNVDEVRIIAADLFFLFESWTADAGTLVNSPGSVSINDMTPTQNQILTATASDLDGISGNVSYQWKRGAVVVGNAQNYTTVQADVGQTLTASASYVDDLTTSEQPVSNATSAVTNINDAPVNTGLPVSTGTASVGNSLNASTGTWTDADGDVPTYSYQWKRGTTNIGIDSNSYALTSADAHANITVVVTADDGNGGVPSATSAITTVDNAVPVNTLLPVITGTASVGNSLNASTGTWTDADGDVPMYSYQWKRGATNVGTGNSYNLTTADAHANITVVVTADDGNGGTAMQNIAVTVSNNANDAPPGIYGGTITATGGLAHNASGLITSNGKLVFIDLVTFEAINGTIADISITASVLAPPNSDDLTGTITSAVGNNITGTYTSALGDGSFNLNADSTLYSRSASFAKLLGTWVDNVNIGGTGITTWVFQNDGSYAMTSTASCNGTGQFSLIDATKNEYEMDFMLTNCGVINGTYTGIGTMSDTSNIDDTLTFMFINGAGTVGGLFEPIRQ